MKAGISLIFIVMISTIVISFIIIDNGGTSGDSDPEPVFIEEHDGMSLYRLDLKNGPLYYYQIPTEFGDQYRVVSFTSVEVTIKASY